MAATDGGIGLWEKELEEGLQGGENRLGQVEFCGQLEPICLCIYSSILFPKDLSCKHVQRVRANS